LILKFFLLIIAVALPAHSGLRSYTIHTIINPWLLINYPIRCPQPHFIVYI